MDYPDAPGSGHALRTGRTVETYSEARQLSAKQTASIPSRKYPSSDSIHSYRLVVAFNFGLTLQNFSIKI